MSIKQFLIISVITASTIAGQALPASSYGFTDFLKDQSDNFRTRFISTQWKQKYVTEMSYSSLDEYKKEYGDPGYIPYVDAWCGDQVHGQGYSNNLSRLIGRNGMINGVFATWRYENGKVNCYVRYR